MGELKCVMIEHSCPNSYNKNVLKLLVIYLSMNKNIFASFYFDKQVIRHVKISALGF